MATQYQQKVVKIYAIQYDGTSARRQEMLAFAPDYLYETPARVLMQVRNPFPIEVGEWVAQYSNTNQRGGFFRVPESNFNLTWGLVA